MFNTPFDGPIPSEVGKLESLKELYLGSNELTGTIPSELSKLESLYYIDISYNLLFGSIPTEFQRMTQLRGLFLSGNQLTGEFPVELCDIKYLLIGEQGNDTVFECYPEAQCFRSPDVGIPDCRCHSSCSTCGYDSKPTTAEQCLSCPGGSTLNSEGQNDDWYFLPSTGNCS